MILLLPLTGFVAVDSDTVAPGLEAQIAGAGQRIPVMPDCTGPEQWPTSLAFAALKNNGITDSPMLNFTGTTTRRLASEPIAGDLFRQVHHVTFTETLGRTLQVITVSDASRDDCSVGGVDVYVIGQTFRQRSP